MQEGRKRVARITVKSNDAKRAGGIRFIWQIFLKEYYSLSGRYILWNTGIMTDVRRVSRRLAAWFLGLTILGDTFSIGDFDREDCFKHETEGGGDAVRAQVSHERQISYQRT